MDQFLLPATAYQSPPRLARKQTLNTIIEDEFSEREDCSGDEREADGRNTDGRETDSRGRDQYLRPARSTSASPVPSLTSSISSYYKSSRQSDDFDDMYDVSDDDSDIALSEMTSISEGSVDSCGSPQPPSKPSRYPSLVIPSPSYWPTVQKAQTISPPRPPKIPISPAALSMLGHDLPALSHPPSLDGSLNSDPFINTSGPVTPEHQLHLKCGELWGDGNAERRNKAPKPELRIRIDDGSSSYNDADFSPEDGVSVHDFGIELDRDLSDSPILGSEDGCSEVGVQLPPDALDTLKHLSLDVPEQSEFASPTDSEKEMEEIDMALIQPCRRRPSSADVTPMSQTSDYSISGLSIPSPGGFFSSLGSNARHTWSFGPGSAPTLPPSSAVAEEFYNCPWSRDFSTTVQQIVEVDDNDTDGPPTARQIPPRPAEDSWPMERRDPETPRMGDRDEGYDQAIQDMAEKSLDRTSVWLAAQTSYMSSLRQTYPASEVGLSTEGNLKRMSKHLRNDSLGSPIQKAVRFLESEVAQREYKGTKNPGDGESIYYHAFQHIQAEERRIDAFRHRHTRSDSLQSTRINLQQEHVVALQGRLQITHVVRPDPKRPISMFPGKETEQSEETAEQKVIARVDRERQALEQVNARMWVVEAAKYLNGGKLLHSPAVAALNKVPTLDDIENGKVNCPSRALDLGGQPNGDWAWHASREYQFARIYTASVEQQLVDPGIRGPRNHRRVAVTELWQLPYPDNYFNAISARSLFAHLKTEKPLGQSQDEYDLCLQECLRCLKPGGYLEWFMMDSEIVNAGTRGTAASVELGFNLKTRGYDPVPTKSWLGRVRRAGFDDIKRAWTFLPMGTPTKDVPPLPETPPPNVSTFDNGSGGSRGTKVEAVQGPVGSTADAASMAGLVGSWAWEQWMLKLQLEMGKEEGKLLEGVPAVLEEGKSTGAGWRCLSGWARKPC